ncbi:MAG: hypothetical protein A3F11_03020 [Gammaproteobacteria bacterium RIFCSPHIGHO2_12_FULL_37_14]|nr:MAG: hypothetical protein A3F11_03020 [Gammaproteobacteria bacterium RIFCSPHIGHO2_12_FULL_37_14]
MRIHWEKIASFINGSLAVKKWPSAFLYYFSQSMLATKIRHYGRAVASSYDFCAVIIAWSLAFWVFSDATLNMMIMANNIQDAEKYLIVKQYWKEVIYNLFWVSLLQLSLFRYFGLYRGFWRFSSIQDLKKIVHVSIVGSLITGTILRISPIFNSHILAISSSHTMAVFIITLVYCTFLVIFLSFGRFSVRLAKDYKKLYSDFQRVIIVGAGNAGESLVRDLLRDRSHFYKPVAFIDDDLCKQGREIHGVRVLGPTVRLPLLIEKYKIDLVFIAIPSASSANMRSVVEVCEKSNVPCFTLPGIKDLANGRVSINVLRRISLEDLLGRYPATCQWDLIEDSLRDKTILVTGGGGSIGSELCRQIASLSNTTRLVVMDSNEYNLYAIETELRQRFPSYAFHSVLLSVADRVGVQALLREYRPHLVLHAAAYKHVPLLEHQPRIAIHNNIVGTLILAEEAAREGVEKFILISSDKAVNPTNIMGATKRGAEYFCQNFSAYATKTQFITVRFGNVLDSAGSVVPLFRRQIESDSCVTVTHPEITRFFMTITEASQLILQATFLGCGGEIFVLDMGEPVKIRYLAEQMIKLAGKVVDQDIKIIYTGLRPGEKLYEECFYSDEFLQPTIHTKILKAQSHGRDFCEVRNICYQLEELCKIPDTSYENFICVLQELVPEYQIGDGQKKAEFNGSHIGWDTSAIMC